jgi:hypothetical protein
MIIEIGADELILWLRKNGRAADVRNDVLGKNICTLIESVGGTKIRDDTPVYWDDAVGSKNIGDKNLPKTAEQYKVDTSKLDAIYTGLSGW